MKSYPHVKQTRREFIRERRKTLKLAKKAYDVLESGCALWHIFDGTQKFQNAVRKMKEAIKVMDEITKPLV